MTGQIKDDDDSCYRQEIDRFVNWCDLNYSQLIVGKTKEMVIDFRRKVPVYSDVVIKGETVEKIETYRYLGIVIDHKLSWKQNLKYIIKKTHSRFYCLRKLRSLMSVLNYCNCFTLQL